MAESVKTISIVPSPEGYRAIARQFAESILGDVRKTRQTASRALLEGLIDIAYSLGANAPTREARDEFVKAVLG